MDKGHWSMGLIRTIKDPANYIISSNFGIVIKDKFPKSKYHYLVVPKEDIPSIYHLKPSHLDLLLELHLLAVNIIEVMNCTSDDFKIGFHAQPSMQRLHLHVISKDFVSPYLKTKKHWNSFNTSLFLPFEDLVQNLETDLKIGKLNDNTVKKLTMKELHCNQCNFTLKNMPDLKSHLLRHLEERV